jgi:hypothetical protein
MKICLPEKIHRVADEQVPGIQEQIIFPLPFPFK